MINSLTRILLIFFVIVSLVLYFINEKQKETIEKYEFGSKYLSQNINKKIKIKNNKVTILYREKDVVKEKLVYVPKEGEITIIQKKDEKEPEIIIKNKGFTFRYGFGILYNKNFYPQFDLKFYYYKQYSLNTFLYPKGIGISVSRHIDDILGDNFSNTEILFGYDILNKKSFIGLKTNF